LQKSQEAQEKARMDYQSAQQKTQDEIKAMQSRGRKLTPGIVVRGGSALAWEKLKAGRNKLVEYRRKVQQKRNEKGNAARVRKYRAGYGRVAYLNTGAPLEPEKRGVQQTPPIKVYHPPLDTEINSMDGVYRPFTLGETGRQLERRTIFDIENNDEKKGLFFPPKKGKGGVFQ